MAEPQKQHNQSQKIIAMPSAGRAELYSEEAEAALLGAILIEPNAYFSVAKTLTADDFFFQRHGAIWASIAALIENNEAVDTVTVVNKLRSNGHLELIGGETYITKLIADTPTAAHVWMYGQLVLRAASRREMIAATDQIKSVISDLSIPEGEARKQADAIWLRAAADTQKDELTHIHDLLMQQMDHVENAMADDGLQTMGVPTGIRSLDHMLDGLHKGRVYVVAGRPHNGKTGLMLSMALNASMHGARVAIFNVADGDEHEVVRKLIGMEIGVSPHRLLTGRLTNDEWQRYVQAAGVIAKRNLFIKSKKGMSPREMYLEARGLQHETGLDLVIVDYIQRVEAGTHVDPRIQSDPYRTMKYVSAAFSKMASSEMLHVPIVLGAQINRSSGGKRPEMSMIKGAGDVEENADVCLLVHRPGMYSRGGDVDPNITEVIAEKNKVTNHTGLLECPTSQDTTRFYDINEWSGDKIL